MREAPSSALVETFAHELRYAAALWEGLSYADLAHVLMLIETGIVPEEPGRRLLGALVEMHDAGLASLDLDPKWGDLYNNRDAELEKRLGSDAGWMHAGRARREALTLGWLIQLRAGCRETLRNAAVLIEELARLANQHVDTLMPDFTYLQHAHPTTLGHYLLGFAYPILRDAQRLENEIAFIDSCPGGSASTNGSRLPLDRERVQELLGFAHLTVHARDAMWQSDVAIHLMALLVSLATTLDRLAEELQIWSTAEFGYVTLSDRHCRTSVIMPQKKNPYALTVIRGKAREMGGQLVSVVATNQTPSGQLDNRNTAYELLPSALQTTQQILSLMSEVLAEARFQRERLEEQAESGWTCATELADLLMQRERIDARRAHEIVGAVVGATPQIRGLPAEFAKLLATTFFEQTGRKLADAAAYAAALQPIEIMASRVGRGSSASSEVRAMAAELSAAVSGMMRGIDRSVRDANFPERLRRAVSRFLGREW